MILGFTSNMKKAPGYCFAAGGTQSGTKSVMLQHTVTESTELVKKLVDMLK